MYDRRARPADAGVAVGRVRPSDRGSMMLKTIFVGVVLAVTAVGTAAAKMPDDGTNPNHPGGVASGGRDRVYERSARLVAADAEGW